MSSLFFTICELLPIAFIGNQFNQKSFSKLIYKSPFFRLIRKNTNNMNNMFHIVYSHFFEIYFHEKW